MASTAAEELEEELDFQQVLIDSLDPGADDFAERLAELEGQKKELETRLELVRSSERRSSTAQQNHQSPGGITGMDGSQDEPYWAAQLPSSSGPPHGAASAGNTPYQPRSMKRPLPYSVLSDSQHPSKRPTPDPSNAGTPTSSADSLEYFDDPASDQRERARNRQLMAEANLKRNRDSQVADADYARNLGQPQTQPWPSASSSSLRPGIQTTLNYNGSFDRPLPRAKETPSVTPLPNVAFSNSPYAQRIPSSTNGYGPQTPQMKQEPSVSGRQVVRAGPTEVVDLTGDSDDEGSYREDDIAEIAPVSFTPNNRMPHSTLNNALAVQRMQQHQRQMPGAYPGRDANGHQYVYGNASAMYIPAQGMVQRPSQLPAVQQPNPILSTAYNTAMNGINRLSSVASSFGDSITDLTNLIHGPQHGRQIAGYDDMDLYRRRYDDIANYDPAKTKEEINALLENIRPDEEMPAHLRVSTPDAMTIKLHKYQETGLTWLQKCEDGSNKGGILADEMGLGKTIQMLSLLVTRKSQDPANKTTLIVAPVALMRQWKQEIEQKIKPGRHKLSVYTHHGPGKKNNFYDLRVHDVVLTTFGTLASELKKVEKFQLRRTYDPNARPAPNEKSALLGEDARWYRVVLDEAQCIKNKVTQTAKAACLLKATYRFCMTGTPMMNNIEELFSLIKFLRIKPYNVWEKFRLDFVTPLKNWNEDGRNGAMQKLQGLCKAVMIRRTKTSTFEGKPILVLPERTTEMDSVELKEDQLDVYQNIERNVQTQFNKYLRRGQVGNQYTAILVLLLRLRQAACHPHLIKDFGIAGAADITEEAVINFAQELDEVVVERIKETGGNFECPVCYDAVANPAIYIPCGHDSCRDCFTRITDPANALRDGNENGGGARCPQCRGPIDPKRVTDFDAFKKVHMPEMLTAEEQQLLDASASDEAPNDGSTDDEEEDDEDSDDNTSLKDFVVDDDAEVEFEGDLDAGEVKNEEADGNETVAGPVARRSEAKGKQKAAGNKKGKSAKAKGKKKAKDKTTLADLKKMSQRSIPARKAYLRRLRHDFVTSAKIIKTMELLERIVDETDEKVLIFSQWTSFLDLVEIPIDGEGWGYRRYDGSMNTKQRADAVDDFRDHRKDVRIMLVSLKAGNAGLNLNMASQVIILDPFWNPYIEEQAIDRAHRIGQTRPVQVHRILAEATVEDRIIELQEKKRALISQALDEKAGQNIARLGVQELAYLFGVTSAPTQRIEYQPAPRRRG